VGHAEVVRGEAVFVGQVIDLGGIAVTDDFPEVVFPGNLLLKVNILCLQLVLQLFYFLQRTLERRFRSSRS